MLFSKGFFLLKLGTARGYSRLWWYNKNWFFVIVEGSDSSNSIMPIYLLTIESLSELQEKS